MAIFHASEGRGRITELVLHDGKEVWARAEKGVLELEGELADRFRKIAHLYGYTEQNAPSAPESDPSAEPEPPTDPEPSAPKTGK